MNKLNRSTLNMEEFKKGDIVINCKTEKESIDLFKYLDDTGIDLCIELLKMCDEMWIIDKGFVNSKGVMVEREYCLCNRIPVKLIEIDN